MDQYLPVLDAAQRLGCSRATIWNLIRRHALPTYRRPGDRRTYLRVRDVEHLGIFEPRRPQPVGPSQSPEAHHLPGVDWGEWRLPRHGDGNPVPVRRTNPRRRPCR